MCGFVFFRPLRSWKAWKLIKHLFFICTILSFTIWTPGRGYMLSSGVCLISARVVLGDKPVPSSSLYIPMLLEETKKRQQFFTRIFIAGQQAWLNFLFSSVWWGDQLSLSQDHVLEAVIYKAAGLITRSEQLLMITNFPYALVTRRFFKGGERWQEAYFFFPLPIMPRTLSFSFSQPPCDIKRPLGRREAQ